MITNRQRLDYILDWLAESFPEKAQMKSCACGAKGEKTEGKEKEKTVTKSDRFPSKRELIEASLLLALKRQGSAGDATVSLEAALDEMDETEIGQLLKKMPVDLIDRHLSDMALFKNQHRPTTLQEIIDWDTRHAKDFLFDTI